jgi:hypothetical protein
MKGKDNNHEEAIRRIARLSRPDKPSADFTSRVMERLLAQPEPVKKWILHYQYGILAFAAGIALLMLFFPAWTLFDFDLQSAGATATQFAGNLLKDISIWIIQTANKIPPIGKYAYFIPISGALVVIAAFDQLITSKPKADIINQ